MPEPAVITVDAVRETLTTLLGGDVSEVTALGAGAWSRAYAFLHASDRHASDRHASDRHASDQHASDRHASDRHVRDQQAQDQRARELVARFGRHVSDFEADRDAMAFDGPDLPVPKTILVAPTDRFGIDGFVSISERAHGVFPDLLPVEGWRSLVPSWSAMLRTLWLHRPQQWPEPLRRRFAADISWSARLLSVAEEPADADERNRGWQSALRAAPGGDAAFVEGFAELRRLAAAPAVSDARSTLVHSDLINRNVLVIDDRVSAVFDWGCAIVGDPLYDLAWLDFWSPWHPGLAALDVRSAFAPLIAELGCSDADIDLRWRADCLHIGLGHLAYNANIGDHDNLAGTTRRLAAYL